MSITSGVGLFSGIDTASLIDQLLAIEAQPQILAQQRIIQLQQQQAAFLDVNSRLLSLKTASGAFDLEKLFDSSKATSSNPEVLAASAGKNAAAGAYDIVVNRLVSTQQQLSKGFTDTDASGVGASAFTFETGGGSLVVDTTLAELNGGDGVDRGVFTIEDASGESVTIDLSTAVTVGDVLDAINQQTDVDVTASASGDGLTLSHGGGLSFTVTDAFGDETAVDLGIAGSSSGSLLSGGDIRTVSGASALSLLNDGNGVQFALDGGTISSGGVENLTTDLEITVGSGGPGEATLKVGFGKVVQLADTDDPDSEDVVVETAATTLQDVIDRINAAAADSPDVDVTASINDDGTGIKIVDNSGTGDVEIVGKAGSTTAKDLGLDTGGVVAGATVQGDRLIASLNSTLSKNLGGGAGVMGTVIRFTDRDGDQATVELTSGQLKGSVSDILAEINAEIAAAGDVEITLGFNSAGNGLRVTDSSGGAGPLIVDSLDGVGGSVITDGVAQSLGVATDPAGAASSTIEGQNVQQQWVSLATKLSDLNAGQGIGTGEISITDSTGVVQTLEIGSSVTNVKQLIDFINASPIDVVASLNDQGDGIQIADAAGGSGDLIIEDLSGDVAKNLNLAGTFTDGGAGIVADGSYERVVEFDASDTLDDVAQKINAAGVGVTASILNDGSANAPYHLTLTARQSGSAGVTIVDTGGLDLGLETLSEGLDAVAFFGAENPADGFLITSTTNTLDGVIAGVTLDLESTSPDPVEVVVEQDLAPVTSQLEAFVNAFNNVITAIDQYDSYDAETEQKGVLLGDQSVRNVRARLLSIVQSEPVGVSGQFSFLFEIGIALGEGNKLEFDQEAFQDAYAQDPAGVEALIAASTLAPKEPIEVAPGVTVANTDDVFLEQGVLEQMESLVEAFTNSIDGSLTIKKNSLDAQIELQESRIEQMQDQLDSKRQVLTQQFIAMEQALASLSSQQQALSALQVGG